MILLLKNSEMLKINSIETAKENERGIIEIDTLKKTQENLFKPSKKRLLSKPMVVQNGKLLKSKLAGWKKN